MSEELTPKQRAFVEEYTKDLNATGAYKRAGYKGQGNSAEAAACQLLRNVKVQSAIREALTKRSERTRISADYVLTRLCEEAEDRGKGSSHSARVRALELLGKHLLLFPDRIHHGGDVNAIPIQLQAGRLSEEECHERLAVLAERIRSRRDSLTHGNGTAGTGATLARDGLPAEQTGDPSPPSEGDDVGCHPASGTERP